MLEDISTTPVLPRNARANNLPWVWEVSRVLGRRNKRGVLLPAENSNEAVGCSRNGGHVLLCSLGISSMPRETCSLHGRQLWTCAAR